MFALKKIFQVISKGITFAQACFIWGHKVACNNFATYIAMIDTKYDIKAAGSKD